MKRSFAIALLFLLAPAFASAQERSVTLEAPLDSNLGDPIDIIVTVVAASSDEAAIPEQPFAPFEILAKKQSVELDTEGGTKRFNFELQLICFEVGVHELGPVTARITTASGELVQLESESRSVEVHSLLANEPDPELKPPSDPVVVEQDDYRLLIALGALAILILGAVLAWLFMRWWQRRDRPEPAPPPPPPPWETALAELQTLGRERAAAVQEGRTEEWVDAVSDSIRGYLGRRFGFHGLESTTDEIAEKLDEAKSLSIAPSEAVEFLGQCDLVKFARASLADEASEDLLSRAVSLVERTRPRAVPPQGGAS